MMRRWIITVLALLTPSSLLAQADSDVIVITGVVGPMGGGGGYMNAVGNWTGAFQIAAWREGDGPVQTNELRIEIPNQRENQLDNWELIFPPRTLVRFAILAPVIENENGRAFAELRAPLPRVEDAELLAAAESILNPPPIVDPQFGTFERNERMPGSFEQQRDWLGRGITATLSLDYAGPPGPDAGEQALATMRRVWDAREDWDARVREAIAVNYYELWRDNWRGDDQPVIDREAFKARFVLEAIEFTPDGSLSFIFGDDDLFWGHGMSVDYFADDDKLHAAMFG